MAYFFCFYNVKKPQIGSELRFLKGGEDNLNIFLQYVIGLRQIVGKIYIIVLILSYELDKLLV